MNAAFRLLLGIALVGSCSSLTAAPAGDVTPFPVGDNWAQINWTTPGATDGVVHFGPTDAYGETAADPGNDHRHRVTLFGLQPRTTYHYRVTSKDSTGETYSSTDATFTTGAETFGCEANLTGKPLGGGMGYNGIVTRSQASVVVRTTAEFRQALASARAGDVIYVDDTAAIDLSGCADLRIPGGITLASGRGHDGSFGGLLFTTTFNAANTPPLFRTDGPGIRITGLRLAGPNNSEGRTGPMYHGVYVSYYGTEIDNCEFWGFNYAAVETTAGTKGLHVHHSLFHHNTRTGVGYAVCPSQGVALIEGNLFDFHRHTVASSGQSPSGYEMRGNLVMEHSVSHAFDMHGAADFEKAYSVAIWRFDEGAGTRTADTSEYGRNDPTMHGFDSQTCWTAGKVNTALVFNGRGSYVDCTAHANLATKAFSIMGWIKPARCTGTQTLFSRSAGDGYSLRLVDARLDATLYDAKGAKISAATGSIPAEDWTHVALTFDGTTGRIYVNGTEATSFPCEGTTPSVTQNLLIGRDSSSATSFFRGAIDEVRAYSKCLPASDIHRIYGGNADIAGDIAHVHHNTSRVVDKWQVVVRGRPSVGFWVDHNWFYGPTDMATRQLNATGNFFVGENRFGAPRPAGNAGAPSLTSPAATAITPTGAGTLSTFSVTYTHAQGLPPMLGYPKLHLRRNGEEFAYFTPLTMMPADLAPFRSGRTYHCQLPLPDGSDYSYYFEAYDENAQPAAGTATKPQPGPTIHSTNATPFLYPVPGHPNYVENPVFPARGTPDTEFDFRTVYQDIDNDAPAGGAPQVRLINAQGTDIPGSPFRMVPLTTKEYANGRQFQLRTRLPVGNYRCQIIAADAKGATAVAVPMRPYEVTVKPAGGAPIDPAASTPMTPFDPKN